MYYYVIQHFYEEEYGDSYHYYYAMSDLNTSMFFFFPFFLGNDMDGIHRYINHVNGNNAIIVVSKYMQQGHLEM